MTSTAMTLQISGITPRISVYLTAKYQSYTRAEVQSELQRIFNQQYKLTLTEEVEIRYREEERTDTWTDEDGNEHTDTYTVQVPYEYYILNVKLTNTPLSTIAENNRPPEQLEMYRVCLQTSGNKPLIFGGGSPDTSASERFKRRGLCKRNAPRQYRYR